MYYSRFHTRIAEIAAGPNPIRRTFSRFLWLTRLCILFRFEVEGIEYRFSPSSMLAEMWAGRKYLSNEIHLSERLLERQPNKNLLIVDVGANIGVFSLTLANRHKSCRYLAIEPHPKIFRILKANIKRNKLDVKTLNIALGPSNAVAYISNKHADDMNQVLKEPSKKTIQIQSHTLDSLVNERVFLLKIDVEGMEKAVLDGAHSTLSNVENIIIEVDSINYQKYGVKVNEVFELLVKSGFKLIGIEQDVDGKPSISYPMKILDIRGENIIATRMAEEKIKEFVQSINERL